MVQTWFLFEDVRELVLFENFIGLLSQAHWNEWISFTMVDEDPGLSFQIQVNFAHINFRAMRTA